MGAGTPAKAKKKILVGVSGGPSSAVTAALLKSQGLEVIGAHVQVQDPKAKGPRFGSRCCLHKSADAAKEVCRKLDIPFHLVHAEARFEDKVIDRFVHDLLSTRTPLACIPCNAEIRFGSLVGLAGELGCEEIATGHHAQIFRAEGYARLLRAVNTRKDQSYYLFGLKQEQLGRLLFPLGGFQDAMIERLATEFGLPTQMLGDPREPCFLRGDEYIAYVESRTAPSLRLPGAIKMTDGSVLGEHKGLHAYQVGQRVKLARHIKEQEKYQVIGFEQPTHSLLIGFEKDLLQTEARLSRVNWIRPVDGLRGLSATARFRPDQSEASPCRLTHFENSTIRLEFEQPQKGMVVGQAMVFYEGDEVLGGAYIDVIGPEVSRVYD